MNVYEKHNNISSYRTHSPIFFYPSKHIECVGVMLRESERDRAPSSTPKYCVLSWGNCDIFVCSREFSYFLVAPPTFMGYIFLAIARLLMPQILYNSNFLSIFFGFFFRLVVNVVDVQFLTKT